MTEKGVGIQSSGRWIEVDNWPTSGMGSSPVLSAPLSQQPVVRVGIDLGCLETNKKQ